MKTLVVEELTSYTMQVPDDLPDTNEDNRLSDWVLQHRESLSKPTVREQYFYCDLD